MKKITFVVLLIWAFACQTAPKESFDSFEAKAFEQKIKQMPQATILDVRTSQEYEMGFIDKAQNMDVTSNDFEANIEALDKATPIFVYCKSGKRSTKACEILKNKGFEQIYNLEGGIGSWQDAGLTIVNKP